jgi:hypothetical protein
MSMTTIRTSLMAAALLPLLLSACFHQSDDDEYRFQVSVTNLTNNQPLSPLAVVLHQAGYHGWTAGMMASNGLEALAEGGDTSGFLAEADADSTVLVTASGAGLIMPGSTATVELMPMTDDNLQLSVATMLVNTNDAFTGVSAESLGNLQRGDSLQFYANSYDAGTEANTELASTIPGPAGGGEGYNASRDDVDFVSVHAGVVTADDGLATSTLDESHRFNGPVSLIRITRVE